jgi:phenylpyruvate tautomerase PptA (4-oxalocrotonate tautomerase family)
MPHVIVKLWPGQSEQRKRKLADGITKAVMTTLKYGEESVSVGFEEIEGLDRESVQAGHTWQNRHDLQEARIRAILAAQHPVRRPG